MHFNITIDDAPVDLERIAKSGQMFRWEARYHDGEIEDWSVGDGGYRYIIQEQGNQRYWVMVNGDESIFRSFFRLETNHGEMYREMIRRGPEIEPFLEQRRGLRMLRPQGKVEVLFSFLCSSCNHISRITQMVNALASFGEGSFFPTVEQLLDVTEVELRRRGFGYRGATIPQVAHILMANGAEAYLDELSKGTFEDARREMIKLPGVGKKLADCICLYAFDFGESVPIDTHIWQVLTRLYHPDWVGTNPTDKKYDYAASAFRDRFGELAGAAHQFLFVDNMERYRERSKP